ncbi:MAG: TRAP transporter large permease subunit, partial [Actinobacteria bacterium]|nr:TRAP transporter large permease subunit [Actinomycetota bacterium]
MFKPIEWVKSLQLDLKDWVGLILAIFSLLALTWFPLDAWFHRVTFFMLSTIIILLTRPGTKNKFIDKMISVFLIVCIIGVWFHAITYSFIYLKRAGLYPTTLDGVCGFMLTVICLEMLRRVSGPILPTIAIAAILYALFGSHLPGLLYHKGFTLSRIVTIVYSPSGVFGLMGVVVTYVLVFVTLGAFIKESGVGESLIQLSYAAVGRAKGGSAKIAIVASSLMGTITGSSTANVLTTGAFTIPLMKECGYSSRFAASVEAVASTGGQIMPPIMGAAAFIMADLLGIPYSRIALVAILPALYYYISVFWMVDIH